MNPDEWVELERLMLKAAKAKRLFLKVDDDTYAVEEKDIELDTLTNSFLEIKFN